MATKKSNKTAVGKAAVNPSWNTPSPVSGEPPQLGEVVSSKQATEKLGITSSKLTLLHRRGVIRKYNAFYWGGYLKEDVDSLAVAYEKHDQSSTKARQAEDAQATSNLRQYLLALPVDDTNRDYRVAVKDRTTPLTLLFRKLPTGAEKESLTDSLYEYMYLIEEDSLDMRTALLMREWARKTSRGHTRFAVNRVSLPPVNRWSDPRHEGIVKLMVDAVSTLYDIEIDVMSLPDYNAIGLTKNSTAVLRHLNGQTVLNREHLDSLLIEAGSNAAFLPLNIRVDYWYRSLKNLANSGSFTSNSARYINRVVKNLLSPVEYEDLSAVSAAHEAIQKAVGAKWASLYDSKWLPCYVGELPYVETEQHRSCFELSPRNKRIHPDLPKEEVTAGVWERNLANADAVEHATEPQMKEIDKLQRLLMEFHQKVAMAMPASSRMDAGYSTVLIKALSRRGITPTTLFLDPYRNASLLLGHIDNMHAALADCLVSLGLVEPSEDDIIAASAKAVELSEDYHETVVETVETAKARMKEEGVDIGDDDRLSFVREFLETTGMEIKEGTVDQELLDSLEDLSNLDIYIMRLWGYVDDNTQE